MRPPYLSGGEAAAAGPPEFIEAAKFAGAKAGYVYQKGGEGMGYYREEEALEKLSKMSQEDLMVRPIALSVTSLVPTRRSIRKPVAQPTELE